MLIMLYFWETMNMAMNLVYILFSYLKIRVNVYFFFRSCAKLTFTHNSRYICHTCFKFKLLTTAISLWVPHGTALLKYWYYSIKSKITEMNNLPMEQKIQLLLTCLYTLRTLFIYWRYFKVHIVYVASRWQSPFDMCFSKELNIAPREHNLLL